MTKQAQIDRLVDRAAHLLARIGRLSAAGADTPCDAMEAVVTRQVVPLARSVIDAGARVPGDQARLLPRRPPGRKRASAEIEAALRRRFRDGMGILKAAAEVGCGTSVAQRVKREMAAEEGTTFVTR